MSSSLKVLQTPPTEPEIAAALDACRSVPEVHMIIRRLTFQRDGLLRKQISDEELGQEFENRFNCYADTEPESLTMAMTKDRFIEVVRRILNWGQR